MYLDPFYMYSQYKVKKRSETPAAVPGDRLLWIFGVRDPPPLSLLKQTFDREQN